MFYYVNLVIAPCFETVGKINLKPIQDGNVCFYFGFSSQLSLIFNLSSFCLKPVRRKFIETVYTGVTSYH